VAAGIFLNHKNAEGLEFFTTEHSKQHEIPTGKTTQKIFFYPIIKKEVRIKHPIKKASRNRNSDFP